jgi:hypothetical protein
MAPIPGPAEVEQGRRRERELREADAERAESRRRDADHRPPPSLPDGWYGGQ